MADLKKQFSEVKAHIDAGRYAAARNYLKRIDHPTAREWEARLDKLDPPPARKPAALKSTAGSGMARTFRWIWGILTLMACGWIVYGITVSGAAVGKVVMQATPTAAIINNALGTPIATVDPKMVQGAQALGATIGGGLGGDLFHMHGWAAAADLRDSVLAERGGDSKCAAA